MIATPEQQRSQFLDAFNVSVETDHFPVPVTKASALVLAGDAMMRMFSLAEMMSRGMVSVPQHLRGNPSDCLAVIMQATQWGMNPWQVALKTHVTKSGTLGYEGQLISAVVAQNAGVKELPRYEHFGDWSKVMGKFKKMKSDKGGGDYFVPTYTPEDEKGLGVNVIVHLEGEAEPRILEVMLEQCQPRFSTQWATDPKQQICYAGIRKWARQHTPGVIMGAYTEDEIEPALPRHMGNADVIQPRTAAPAAAPAAAHPKQAAADAAAKLGKEAYAKFWGGLEKSERLQLAPEHEARKAVAIAADEARTLDDTKTTTDAATTQGAAVPAITAASLKARMEAARAANDGDALGEVADLIGVIADEAERTELEALYETVLGEMA